MAIVQETEIARVEMNDAYGVRVWQHRKGVDYSTAAARELAQEILEAADEADQASQEDVTVALAGFAFDTDEPPEPDTVLKGINPFVRPQNWRVSE